MDSQCSVQGIWISQTLTSEPYRPHETTPLWTGILEMQMMSIRQPGSPKDSSSTSHKYIYLILHMAFNFHRRKRQLLGDWEAWLGLCPPPLKTHQLNYFLFLHFALEVETSQSCWEEKPRCDHWLTIFNWSWTRSVRPVTPTTMPLAPGTRTARGHGMRTR